MLFFLNYVDYIYLFRIDTQHLNFVGKEYQLFPEKCGFI